MSNFIIPNYYSPSNILPSNATMRLQINNILGHSVLKKNYDDLYNAYLVFKLQFGQINIDEDLQIPLLYKHGYPNPQPYGLDEKLWEILINNNQTASSYLNLLNTLDNYLISLNTILYEASSKIILERLNLSINLLNTLLNETKNEFKNIQPVKSNSTYDFGGLTFIKQEKVEHELGTDSRLGKEHYFSY